MKHLLYNLAIWLETNLHKEAFLIYKLADISKAKTDNRNTFQAKFPDEKVQKVYAIADQYYDKFKDRPDFQTKIETFQSLNEVITYIKTNAVQKSPKENKIEEIKIKYPILDPEVDKLAKSNVMLEHYDWVMEMYYSPAEDPIEEIIQNVETYERNIAKLDRDLSEFTSLYELREYLDDNLSEDKAHYLNSIKDHAINPKNTAYVYDSDNFMVVLPGSTQASQFWAQGTTWCTSYIKDNYFYNYAGSRNIYLYYIITKTSSSLFERKDPRRKISVGLRKGEHEQPYILEGEHTTVDLENHEISEGDIKGYLGAESASVLDAIYSDAEKRNMTKYNENISTMTLEEFNSQISKSSPEVAADFKKSLMKNPHTSSEIIDTMVIEDIKKYDIEDVMYLLGSNLSFELFKQLFETVKSKIGFLRLFNNLLINFKDENKAKYIYNEMINFINQGQKNISYLTRKFLSMFSYPIPSEILDDLFDKVIVWFKDQNPKYGDYNLILGAIIRNNISQETANKILKFEKSNMKRSDDLLRNMLNAQYNKMTSENLFEMAQNTYAYSTALEKIILHPNVDSKTLDFIYNNLESYDDLYGGDDIYLKMASSEKASPELLNNLFKQKDIRIWRAIVENKNAPKELVEHIKSNPNFKALEEILF